MTRNLPFQLEPTFPLDKLEIAKRIKIAQLEDPMAWAIAAGTLALGLIGGYLTAIILVPAGIVGTLYYWNISRGKSEAKVISEMISESNREQDRRLSEMVHNFRDLGHSTCATALGKFILLKKRIEGTLHADEILSLSDRNMDNLVDEISSLACNLFDRLCKLDGKTCAAITGGDAKALGEIESERTRILLQVQHAYGAMYRCLNTIVEPNRESGKSGLEPERARARNESLAKMSEAIRDLEDETSLVMHAKDKVREDLEIVEAPVG